MSGESKVRLEKFAEDRAARLVLNAPKANVVDMAMMADLAAAIDELEGKPGLTVVILTGEGPHFSFGASIPEHLPDQIEATLRALHNLVRKIAAIPVPTIAAIRGQCLGGGLELALGCDLMIAEENAGLAVPEIKLGVFPPAASALLPVKLGTARAAELILTGCSWSGAEAKEAGLVARLAPDGGLDEAVDTWVAEDFAGRSPAGLRYAAKAARRHVRRALKKDLPAFEKLYLKKLMSEPDAVEGINAFLEKRKPTWSAGS